MNNKINKLLTTITKEEIEELYIKQNLSKEQVANKLNLSLWSLSNLLKQYKIRKSKDSVRALREQTCINKYGVKNTWQSDAIKEKIKETNRKKYGTDWYLSTKEAHEKSEQTKLDRYGSKTYNNQEQMKITKKVKYNNENYNNRQKCKETMQNKYGVSNAFQLISTKESILDNLAKNKEYTKLFRECISSREKSIELLKDKNYSYFDLVKLFNAPYYTIQYWATRLELKDYINYTFTGKSHYEDDIVEFIKSLNINNIKRNEKILNGLEIDIYLPDYNLGIEFNGTYWHSDLYKDKNYHFNKSLEAQKQNIRLVHIYQYEWDDDCQRDKIKSLLRIALGKVRERIYARDCEIRQITNKEAKVLNNKVHLQNHRNAKVTYGLFYNNELVQLMSFSHHKNYEWEIVRGCPGSNNIVIGGVSKLFKHFIRDYSPKEIFSYCDFNKFDGKSYEALGMKFIDYTGPDMKYIIKDSVINRQPAKYKEIKNSIDARIYGAGSLKYLWTN